MVMPENLSCYFLSYKFLFLLMKNVCNTKANLTFFIKNIGQFYVKYKMECCTLSVFFVSKGNLFLFLFYSTIAVLCHVAAVKSPRTPS